MRKLMTMMLAALMVLAMSSAAFADSLTASSAADKALANAGLSHEEVLGLETD